MLISETTGLLIAIPIMLLWGAQWVYYRIKDGEWP